MSGDILSASPGRAYFNDSSTWTPEPITPQPWAVDALCAQTDPEAFFPEKGGSTRDAKRICASCEVTEQCLSYALQNDERFGIWGGLSERERRRLRRLAAPKSRQAENGRKGAAALAAKRRASITNGAIDIGGRS